ncbi:MAG: SDR family NAD(P)-dependent oxidoreductase [Solirubrobacteraceae bacterium]
MSGVEGRSVIVTGAGRGLGRAHALALGAQGAHVVVNDLGVALDGSDDERSAADAVAAEIVADGGDAIANHDDVATTLGGDAVVQAAIDGFGRVDGVVNNAGILRDRTFHKMSAEEFDAVLKVHLYGSFNVTRAAVPHFREQAYGRIVVTTSITGLYGNFGQVNYGAAKLGLVGMINTLAIEGRTRNVLANAVSPIATTRMSADVLDEEVDPAYVAALVVYLLGEECTTSGEVIHAAGGRYARIRYMESRGVEFNAVPTDQQLAQRWDEILDMRDAQLAPPA